MADLTQGLLQGLNQGIQSYFQADERRQDREQRKRELEDQRLLSMTEKGLIRDPMGEGYMKDPSLVAKDIAAKRSKIYMDLINQGIQPTPDMVTPDGDLNPEALSGMGGGAFGNKAIDRELKQMDLRLKQADLNKSFQEQAEKREKKALAKDTQDRYSKVAIEDAERALEMIPGVAGPWRGQLGNIPGTKAAQLEQMLDSVKSSASFDRLQAMRAASPTGGALGNVSEKELALLQAAAGKLTAAMNPKDLEDNLKRYINLTNDIIHGPGQGPKRYALSFQEKKEQTPGPIGQAPGGLIAAPGGTSGGLIGQPSANAANDTVRVKNPNGQIGTIPRRQLEAARAQGYMEVK